MTEKEYWVPLIGCVSKEINSEGCDYNGWHYFMIPIKDWFRHPIKSHKLFLRQKPSIKSMKYE